MCIMLGLHCCHFRITAVHISLKINLYLIITPGVIFRSLLDMAIRTSLLHESIGYIGLILDVLSYIYTGKYCITKDI